MEIQEIDSKIRELIGRPIESITNPLEQQILKEERGYCGLHFTYWLAKYAKLAQAPTIENPGGIIPFQVWEHTRDIIWVLLHKKLISILKSRQIGASWIIAAYCLWCALFHPNDKTLLFSKGKVESMELLDKCKTIYTHLPHFLKLSLGSESQTKISFPSIGSSIEAFPATENAGIGFQVSRIICDEHIEHEYAVANYMAAKPTIDSGGGQFISIFTSNENKLDSLAVELFKGGLAKTNGFTSLFFPYTVRPGRSDEWYAATKRSIPTVDLQGLTPDVYMARSYPKSIDEALSPSKTIAVFDKDVLDAMMGQVESPITLQQEGIDNGIVHVYRPYSIGEYYIAASDTSHGIAKDYNVTVILNVKTGAVAADIYNNRLSPEELALQSVRLLKLYSNPLWYIEDNDWGRVTINTAQELGYNNFGYRDEKKDKVGWHTDEKTRMDALGAFIPAVNNRQVVIYNKAAVKSLYDIIRNPEKGGRIEAIATGHDDYCMCLAIAWCNKDKVQTTIWKPKPISSLTFGDNSANPALIMR